MTVEEFDGYLINTKAELMGKFKNIEDIKDLDVYTKTVLDFQELIAKQLFGELKAMRTEMLNIRGDLLKDNRERFTEIMAKLNTI